MTKYLTYPDRQARTRPTAMGFSLIELLITLTLAGILAAAAAPSFRGFIASQRIKTASFDLIAALTQTRSEAIKRNGDVTMTAAGGGWIAGWTIVSGTTTIATKSAYSGLTISEKNSVTAVTFQRNGRLPTGTATIYLTVDSNPTNPRVKARCISLSLSGQASSAVGACP